MSKPGTHASIAAELEAALDAAGVQINWLAPNIRRSTRWIDLCRAGTYPMPEPVMDWLRRRLADPPPQLPLRQSRNSGIASRASKDMRRRHRKLFRVAVAKAGAGDCDTALDIAGQIQSQLWRDKALCQIARLQARDAQSPDPARLTASRITDDKLRHRILHAITQSENVSIT